MNEKYAAKKGLATAILTSLAVTIGWLGSVHAQSTIPSPIDDRIEHNASDWLWWRGPTRNGEASADQLLPAEWGEEQNVLWKAPIEGRGHGSPIVVGDRVIIQTCNEQHGSQSVVCFSRQTGDLNWQTTVHEAGAMQKNEKASAASSTAATDGDRIYVNFANSDAVYTTALSMDGDQLWQTKISDYIVHQGYGSSPALYQDLVLVSADNKAGGRIAALERDSGDIRWSVERPEMPNYPSPTVVHADGRDQLIMIGCELVTSYDPLTGDINWEIEGATTECVTSTVTDGDLIYSSGGYPKNHLSAIRADGSGEIVWETNDRIYVPSLLIRDEYLYGVMDVGVAGCWHCETGEVQWKQRLEDKFTSSPVLVGDRIYATNESGKTFIFQANPKEFVEFGTNQLGNEVLATPTICGGRIYHRVAYRERGSRQEFLFCIADE